MINKVLCKLISPQLRHTTIYNGSNLLKISNRLSTSSDPSCTQNNRAQFKIPTIDVLEKWNDRFIQTGVDEPKLSIENILAHTFRTKRISDIYKPENSTLNRQQIKDVIRMCKMRLRRMPIQYIVSEWDFKDLTLEMRPPIFIPRPETEGLVDLVSAEIRKNETRMVLELCCGSGAISIALLKEHPNLKLVAIDKSKEACNLTKDNARKYGLSDRINVIQMDVKTISPDSFDKFNIIVSNPPYIPSNDIEHLQPEILEYEDRDALDGGSDGLVLIKLILQKSSYLLHDGGKTFLEVDPSHPPLLDRLLRENNRLGLSIRGIYKDIFERDRFAIIKKS